ncbi:hypothetical protein OG786_01150 [Streptomyces sp. NBC_00101]
MTSSARRVTAGGAVASSRGRATLVLRKSPDHKDQRLSLRTL